MGCGQVFSPSWVKGSYLKNLVRLLAVVANAVVAGVVVMKLMSRKNLWSLLGALIFMSLWTTVSQAASVYSCTAEQNRCVIKLEEGIVGDRVSVLDEKARNIAQGRIIKRRGAYAVVDISSMMKNIRKGYPVIVDIENQANSLEWVHSRGE